MAKKQNIFQRVFDRIRNKPADQWTLQEEEELLNMIDVKKMYEAINSYKPKKEDKLEHY